MNQKILHNKLAYLKKLNLFKNLKSFESFESLEQAIANLNENDLEPQSKKRLKSICVKKGEEAYRKALQGALNNLTGAVGEVIAAGYLNLNGDKDIYPSERISNKIKRKYKMATGKRDAGVDICSVDAQSKKHKAVQVKWFSHGEDEIVPISKLSTAFSDSENFDQRTIITNAKDISKSLKNKNRLTIVNRIRLKNYFNKANLKKLYKLIKRSKNPTPPKFEPLPHQAKAIDDCLKGFKDNSVGQLIMACGTGKTLTSMWVAKGLGAKKIVVFVPSISLAGQLMKEWWYHGQFGDDFPFVTVCSDPTVAHELDGMAYQLAELDYPVTTDAKELKKALKSSEQHVVICTYHSARILKKAGLEFDFGYFDEAHRTTGNHGDSFSFALNNRNIKIRKRLFGTATPKVIEGRTTSRINSMDNDAVYGSVFHELGFSQAVDQKLIVPVKIITCHISSKELSRELVKMGITQVNDVGNVRTCWLANLFAFKKALEKFNLKKTFAYTSTIKAAKELAFNDSLGIESFIANTESFHVNGGIPSNARSNEIDHFSNSPKAVMTNVRCLVEGVDLPAVDCVAFFQPRKSVVDIIQAVGRAMRRSGNKKCGYIFVPLYVEKGKSESLEEAMAEQTSYKILLDVITAMAEHNDALREKLTTIQRLQVSDNPPEGPIEKLLEDEFEHIGAEEVDINLLKNSISVELLRLFSNSRAGAWDRFVVAAEMLHKKYGHCNTAHRHLKNAGVASRIDDSIINNRYREAIRKARQDYTNNRLLPEEIKMLESFNIDWKSDAEYELGVWESRKNIWRKEKEKGKKLTKPTEGWGTNQLTAIKNGQIKKGDEKWKLLDEIGFFDPHFNSGGFLSNQKHRDVLSDYVKRFGHARKNSSTMTKSEESTCNTIIGKYKRTKAQQDSQIVFSHSMGSLLSTKDIEFYDSLPYWSWDPEKDAFKEKVKIVASWAKENPKQTCKDAVTVDNPYPFSFSKGPKKHEEEGVFFLGRFLSYHVRLLRKNLLKDWQIEVITEELGNIDKFENLILPQGEWRKTRTNFTPEEDEILKKKCAKMSDRKLSETLLKKHSTKAIGARRKKLGIYKARNGHTGQGETGNPLIS